MWRTTGSDHSDWRGFVARNPPPCRRKFLSLFSFPFPQTLPSPALQKIRGVTWIPATSPFPRPSVRPTHCPVARQLPVQDVHHVSRAANHSFLPSLPVLSYRFMVRRHRAKFSVGYSFVSRELWVGWSKTAGACISLWSLFV